MLQMFKNVTSRVSHHRNTTLSPPCRAGKGTQERLKTPVWGKGWQVVAGTTSRELALAFWGEGGLEGATKEGGYLRSELKSSTRMISWIRWAGVRFRTLEQGRGQRSPDLGATSVYCCLPWGCLPPTGQGQRLANLWALING